MAKKTTKKQTTKSASTVNHLTALMTILFTPWPKIYGYGRQQTYSALTRLAIVAEMLGFDIVAQGSKAHVFGINDHATGKRVITPYTNKNENTVFLCLNGVGTNKKYQIPENIKKWAGQNEFTTKRDGSYYSVICGLDSLSNESFTELLALIPGTVRQPSVQNTRPAK